VRIRIVNSKNPKNWYHSKIGEEYNAAYEMTTGNFVLLLNSAPDKEHIYEVLHDDCWVVKKERPQRKRKPEFSYKTNR
jgi:predicted RNA-binding protein with PUA domain